MKFRVMMKDPDVLHETIVDTVREQVEALGLSDEERDALVEIRTDKIREMCVRKWFRYGEYLEVEVDTEAGTCTVVPNGG